MSLEAWLPSWSWVLENQRSVLWIYLGLLACLTVRIWLTLRMWTMPQARRSRFLDNTHVLSEVAINVPVLLGVLGTLIGVMLAISGKTGGVSPAKFLAVFSQAFNVAVCTTIAGGLTYIACFLLSSLDDRLADDGQ